MSMPDEIILSASAFEARCLDLIEDLEARRLRRVVVTHHGRPVAALTAVESERPTLLGCMRGSVRIPEGVDLAEPHIDELLDAEQGVLYR